jgi:hypothetical protein
MPCAIDGVKKLKLVQNTEYGSKPANPAIRDLGITLQAIGGTFDAIVDRGCLASLPDTKARAEWLLRRRDGLGARLASTHEWVHAYRGGPLGGDAHYGASSRFHRNMRAPQKMSASMIKE